MDDFDPSNPGGGDYEKTDSTPLPPGRYILIADYVGRDKKHNGKHRTKFLVIAGPGKGRTPWWNIDVGVHPRARARLAGYCRAVGNMEKFNPGDLRQLVARFKGVPFVATLGIREWGDPVVKENEVSAYHEPEEWTELERRLIAEWKAERSSGHDDGLSGASIPPDDDMGMGSPPDQDGDPGPGDGIPF